MVDVTLTDTKIVLSDKSAERGEGVDFKVRNAGKKAHSFALLAASPVIISLDRQGFSTPLLKPGKTSVISVFMDARGTFVYRSLAKADRSKPRHARQVHGELTVRRVCGARRCRCRRRTAPHELRRRQGRSSSDWPLPAADLEGTRAGSRVDRRGQRVEAPRPLAVPPHREAELLRNLRLDTRRRRRHGLRPGSPQQRLRPRPRDGQAALVEDLLRAERRAERARGRGRAASTARPTATRSRSTLRPAAQLWTSPSDGAHRAVRRHRAGAVAGLRLRQHDRLPARRPRRDVRPRRSDRKGPLALRHDQGAVALSARGRRRRALVSGLDRRRRTAVRRQLESVAVGRHARASQRRLVSRACPLHGLAARARRAQRRARSGTTR